MPTVDSVRNAMRDALAASGLTQEEVGVRMGYAPANARQMVNRLLSNGVQRIPRIDSVIAFADALGVSPAKFFRD